MAFAASLIAYLGVVAGIVSAFVIALSALLATPPDQPPSPARAAIVAHQPTSPKVAAAAAPKTTPLKLVKSQQIAKQPGAGRNFAQEARQPRSPLFDLRPSVKQWAYQQELDIGHRRLGYAEQPENPNEWIW